MKQVIWYGKIAAMLCVIAVLSMAVTLWTGVDRTAAPSEDSSLHVVTGIYPVYVAALNVADGVEGVTVENLVDTQAGCLHDYAMTAEDRRTLGRADLLVLNGAGAEAFLHNTLESMPELAVADLSEGEPLLESGHVHDGGHDHAHAEEGNGHLWVSPVRYRRQVERLCEALSAADPAHAAQYEANTAAYLEEVDAVWARMQQAVAPFKDVKTVLLHDSLAYLAEDLDLTVVAALNIGEDTAVDTAALKAAEDALKGEETAMILGDAQYGTESYLQAIPADTLTLAVDTAVAGDGGKTDWIEAMTALCEAWEAAV